MEAFISLKHQAPYMIFLLLESPKMHEVQNNANHHGIQGESRTVASRIYTVPTLRDFSSSIVIISVSFHG